MSSVVIWIDQAQVKIFEVGLGEAQETRLSEKHVDHHTHHFDNLDKDHQARAFFERIVAQLPKGSQFLILGPSTQKTHFRKYLDDHFPVMAKSVVGCETVDHPTDNQIVATARKFFR